MEQPPPESRLARQQSKPARQHDADARQSITPSILKSIIASGTPLNMSHFIHGFQDNTTSWMNSLINQQDGCMHMVAHRASFGRLRQEQLAQTVAMRAPRTEIKFNSCEINWLTKKHKRNVLGQNKILICPRRRTTSTSASTQQRSKRQDIPERSAKRNNY